MKEFFEGEYSIPDLGDFDPRSDSFIAYLSGSTLVSGVYFYTWTEQTFDPLSSIGAFVDVVGARTGDATGNKLVEINNQFVATPCYARVWLRGIVNGDTFYEFRGFTPPVTTSAALTSDQNDYSPGTTSTLDVTTDQTRTITGVTGGSDGRSLTVVNTGNNSLNLGNASTSSSAANRIATGTGGDYTLAPGQSANLVYDGVNSVWRLNSNTAGAANTAITSPAQITSDQNNYATAGYGTLRLSTDATRTITGFGSGYAGRSIEVSNVGTQNLVLADQSVSSLAVNRIVTGFGASYTLSPGQSAQLLYDAVTSVWRLVANTAGAAGATSGSPTGTGTAGTIAKWTGSNTLGNSGVLTESGGNIVVASDTTHGISVAGIFLINTPTNELDLQATSGNGFKLALRDTDGLMILDGGTNNAAYCLKRGATTYQGADTSIGGATVKGGVIAGAVTATGAGAIVQATSGTLTNPTVTQGVNGATALTLTRATDTSATGNFLVGQTSAGVNLFGFDASGTLTSGSVPSARLTGTLAAAQFPALTGDITSTGGSLATTIANSAVTLAKLESRHSSTLMGRGSASSGSPQEISLGSGLSMSGTTLSATGTGTVSSVGLTAPAEITVGGSPITSAGNIALSWTSQTANKVFASPGASSGTPAFRALVTADLPDLSGLTLSDPLLSDVIVGNHSGTNKSFEVDRTLGLLRVSPGGRLTLASGNPVTTSDTSGGVVYYTPYDSDIIVLWDGTRWAPLQFSETNQSTIGVVQTTIGGNTTSASAVVTSLTGAAGLNVGAPITGTGIPAGTLISTIDSNTQITMTKAATATNGPTTLSFLYPNYDVFGYTSSGALALEVDGWTTNNSRNTAITYQDGRYCKSGDKTRLYLGSYRLVTSTAAADSATQRYVWNQYNRVPRNLSQTEPADSWTYTTATWRQTNANANNKVEVLLGTNEQPVQVGVKGNSFATATIFVSNGIGLDTTSANNAQVFGGLHIANNHYFPQLAYYDGYPGIGYHYFAWLEFSAATGTTTFYGDGGSTFFQSGMRGVLFS